MSDTRKRKKRNKGEVPEAPVCPYCDQPSELATDVQVYGRSYGGRMFWRCVPCEAYVGTHRGSRRLAPLGRLANKELRARKVIAHERFDRLWKAAVQVRGWTITQARASAYAWLAGELGMPVEKCHIGYFDLETTERVIQVCERARR